MMLPRTSYSQTLSITNQQRDSIFSKIERGKINAERVHILQDALKSCDSVKELVYNVIGIQKIEIETLQMIISKKDLIISTKDDIIGLEVKRGRRRGFWGFIKGIALGIGLTTAAVIIL